MMKRSIISTTFAFFLLVGIFSTHAFAENENEITVLSGIELDNIITLISSILSIILFTLTFVAYKQSGKSKLSYIAAAFLLFAIKGFVLSSDMVFVYAVNWMDPAAHLLDFAILLLFFSGIIKK